MHAAPEVAPEGAAPPDRHVPARWLSEGAERLAYAAAAPRFDVVIVGSGYGGAVAAARFAALQDAAGRKLTVAVLERGDEFVPGNFPDRFSQALPHLRAERRDDGEPPRFDAGRAGLDHALFDFHIGEQVSALVGNGLGGGSLINAGVVEAPEPAVFADPRWPGPIRAEAAAGGAWQGWFTTATAMLGAAPWRGAAAKTDALFRATGALGNEIEAPVLKVRPQIAVCQSDGANSQGVVQSACIACGNCVTGCNFWAKNTLPMNYLAAARQRGARLFTGATALAVRLAKASEQDGDWIVSYRLTHDRRDRDLADAVFKVAAGRVVLAAGTFGSTQILAQSARVEPNLRHLTKAPDARLGRGFSCNGDGIAAAYDQAAGGAPVDGVGADPGVRPGVPGSAGPTITGMLDLRRRALLADRFVIQDAAIPFALRRIYEELLLSFGMVHRMTTWNERDEAGPAPSDPLSAEAGRLERTQFLLMIGHDDAGWRLDLQETASRAGAGADAIPLVVTSVAKRTSADMAAVRLRQNAMNAVVALLAAPPPGGGGGVYIPNPAWQPAPAELADALRPDEGGDPDADPLAAERLLTVHPLGGCAMADTVTHGVVNHLGQVFRATADDRMAGEVFANLVVMDGSTVPCSLGINPLLTICALAERSCERLQALWQFAPDTTPPPGLPAQPGPVEPLAWRPATTALLFNETMDGALSLVVNKNADLRRLNASERAEALDAKAVLRIRAPIADLWGLVCDPHHEIPVALGELKLFWKGSDSGLPPFDLMPVVKPPPSSPRELVPIAMPVRIRLLELLPSGRDERIWRALRHWWAARGRAFLREGIGNRVLRKLAELGLRAVLGVDSARIRGWLRELLEWIEQRFEAARPVLAMVKIASHHGEARAMTYELPTLAAEHTPFNAPVRVLAAKRIHYGLSTGYRQRPSQTIANPRLPRWVPSNPWRAVVELQVLMVSESEGRPLVDADWPADQRPTWLDPRRHRVVATGTWTLDLEAMIGGDVPQLLAYQTLPDAWLDTVSFAAFLGRTLLQSYFWSWRLPAYPPALRFGGADLGPLPGFRLSSDGKTYVEMPGRGKTWEQRTIGLREVAENGKVVPGPPAELVLTHFWPGRSASNRRRHPVVMLHGFVTSGYQFATPRLKTNAVDWLTAQGFDVWVVDLRTSVAVASSHEAWDFDTVAMVDVPAAIDAVLAATGAAQVHVVAHCMGSAAFNMAVLAGGLRHVDGTAKVRSAVQTLVSMDVVSTPPNRLKASGVRFVEDMFQADELRVSADREVLQADRIVETLADRLLMTWPKNDVDAALQADNDLWKPRADYVATVNRINALYGRNFSHQNLSKDMRRHLPEVFRHANVRTFRHVMQFHRAGRVVDRHGNDAYVTDENIRAHYRFPVRFLHGQFGAVFRPASTRRSRIRLDRLLPQYVHERITLRAPRDAKGRPVRPNWGHFDIWLSEHSAAEVFPKVSEFLAAHDSAAPVVVEPPRPAATYRYEPPDLGPWLGWWRADPAHAGAGLARIWFRSPFRHDTVEVAVFAARADAMSGVQLDALTGWQTPPLQQRCGTIDVSVPAPPGAGGGWGLAVVCRSPQTTWFDESDSAPRHPNRGSWWSIGPNAGEFVVAPLAAPGPLGLASGAARAAGSSMSRWLTGRPDDDVAKTIAEAFASAGRDLPPELIATPGSIIDLPDPDNAIAAASAAGPPVLIGPRLFAQLAAGERVTFLLASCRYQATEMEAVRANRSLISPRLDDVDVDGLDFALFVGDQIYADASYGVLDGRPSRTRLRSKYTSLWAGSAGALGRRLPLYLCADDHEVRDDWFDGVRTSADQGVNDCDGFAAMDAYQYAAMPGSPGPLRRARDYGFQSAGFRFHVLDTRFERKAPGGAIWSQRQRAALAKFLADAGQQDPARPVFIVSSVPVLPFERGLGDAEDLARGDHWQSYPASLGELFAAIAASKCRHVVLLSGDRHLCQLARGSLRATDGSGDIVAIDSIVSSGLNAPIPFANQNPGDLLSSYAGAAPGLPGHDLAYQVMETKTSDGYARIEVVPMGAGWAVSATFL